MKAKIHSEKTVSIGHWASHDNLRVISVAVEGQRIFLRHSIAIDRRGTHYGEGCEEYSVIRGERRRRQLRRRYRGSCEIDDSVVAALLRSTGSIYRSFGLGDEGRTLLWCEVVDHRCGPLAAEPNLARVLSSAGAG